MDFARRTQNFTGKNGFDLTRKNWHSAGKNGNLVGKRGSNHQNRGQHGDRGPTKIQKNMRVEGKHHLLYCIFSVFLIWKYGFTMEMSLDYSGIQHVWKAGVSKTRIRPVYSSKAGTHRNSAVYKGANTQGALHTGGFNKNYGLKMAVNIMPWCVNLECNSWVTIVA